jgi:intracellular sulfur oxidation DsrE/DsrF family protein
MYRYFRTLALAFASLLAIGGAASAQADDLSAFADYHYVLQISDMDAAKQELILNNATNLMEAYPPGAVSVEIVAFGPGLRLLFANNVNAERIDGLAQSGVRFSACGNTLKGMTKLLGAAPKLNPDAKVVPAGIVRIGDLVKKGYIYIRP